MTIRTRPVEYRDGDRLLAGEVAWDDAAAGPRPGILVAHTWAGRGEAEQDKARQLAELGYAGFALDLFGKGVRGTSIDENRELMRPFMEDRGLLQRRMQLALAEMRSLEMVDPERSAAVGFCFGGLCVLDLARTGSDIRGVVSFHGMFTAPGNTEGNRVRAKVLALHGWDDPMVPPEQVVSLGRELTAMGADWQIHAYGHTMHAFTNPAANNPDFGAVYQPDADRRSWQSMQNFLAEVLS